MKSGAVEHTHTHTAGHTHGHPWVHTRFIAKVATSFLLYYIRWLCETLPFRFPGTRRPECPESSSCSSEQRGPSGAPLSSRGSLGRSFLWQTWKGRVSEQHPTPFVFVPSMACEGWRYFYVKSLLYQREPNQSNWVQCLKNDVCLLMWEKGKWKFTAASFCPQSSGGHRETSRWWHQSVVGVRVEGSTGSWGPEGQGGGWKGGTYLGRVGGQARSDSWQLSF